jgi:DNA-binding SARP family transcriptional activator
MAPPLHTPRRTPSATWRSRLLHQFSTELNVPPQPPAGSLQATLQLVGMPALLAASGAADALERKDAALLALLATAGATPRASLAALLWPDADDDGARNSLRQRVFRLKRAAGGDVVTGGVALRLADGVVHDLAALPARLSADPQALPGELLGTLDYSDCAELAAWVEIAREQWRAARRDALAEAAARLEGERHISAALPYALRLVADEPLLEHAHRRVMRLHYLRGDRAAAHAAYEQARRVLARDLGVVPAAETEQLAALVRGEAVADAGLAAHPSPVLRSPRLVGRECEWACLQSAAASHRVVLVSGDAGIGKTRLITDFVAHCGAPAVIGARPGDARVPYVVLSRLAGGLAQRFGVPGPAWAAHELARIAPAFGTAPPTALDPLRLQQALVELLAQWQTQGLALIALDDLHVADDATLEMLPALTHAPGAAIAWLLATRSGELPAALGNWCAAEESSGPLPLPLGPLDAAAIEALLESLALADVDAARWAAPLARHTGGNPMFILETLMAMQSEGAMTRGADIVLPASVGVAALVERRLDQLSAPALKLARVAAIAGQDFSVELAAAILRQSAVEITDAWRRLETAQVIHDQGFAHELIREATLRSVPAPIARVMHGEVAAELEARDAPAVRIAQHWAEAQQFAHAGAWFARAAAEARNASRPGDEAALLQRAAACAARSAG